MDKQKKQMMMMGALLLVLVAVGAFQFMGPKPAAPTTDATVDSTEVTATAPGTEVTPDGEATGEETEVAAEDASGLDPVAQQLVRNQLPTRDPFLPTSAAQAAALDNAQQGLKTAGPVNPPTYQAPPKMGGSPSMGGGALSPAFNPLPNVDPNQQIGLPPVGGNGSAPPNLEPAKRSGYKVVGTIVGKQKMVVLEDPDGNQVLVPEGKKTPDGKARVVGVQKGKAKVSQEGQVKMLGLEEE